MTALYAIAGACLAAGAVVIGSGVLAVAATMLLVAAWAEHTLPEKVAARKRARRGGYIR